MIKSVKIDGYLVIANCFNSVIKCHLPQIFHLKYTLNQFVKILWLDGTGLFEDSYATIYKKVVDVNLFAKNKLYEKLSKIIFSTIETLKPILRPIKGLIKK